MPTDFLRDQLRQKGLKVTPQRLAVYGAVASLKNHPTVEHILEYVRTNYPDLSTATVYKVLDTLVENNLLHKVKSENGIMRYDAVLAPHHHLYCAKTDRIEDYRDEQLDHIITNYFRKKKIKNFNIQDVKLQITGTFKNQIND